MNSLTVPSQSLLADSRCASRCARSGLRTSRDYLVNLGLEPWCHRRRTPRAHARRGGALPHVPTGARCAQKSNAASGPRAAPAPALAHWAPLPGRSRRVRLTADAPRSRRSTILDTAPSPTPAEPPAPPVSADAAPSPCYSPTALPRSTLLASLRPASRTTVGLHTDHSTSTSWRLRRSTMAEGYDILT
jgi:hypothetical protein